ncbi:MULTISPECIES: NAD(P)H-dependent oxidoreductase [unclassified Duganella]|uniref:NAD(P)H-dependent oxidoreductase n=1 Tax=unclassified Duganella TaxID=2636909 RepID=UPI0008848A62|nr:MULTISPECIES: NAD(P)H-dependent oxidoreductase [unclassified Duganella]SDG04397.1 NAD(P)H dehydrogenase (quinone) [Duganella sp. OV458]SDJ01036.1 NAD(P)H dehydrogenase (quinone) [Duganella sp. OV510]
MNILIVYAHPDPRSLNGALKDYAVEHLQASGHAVQVSDLYAMQWRPTLEAGETPGPEVLREQEKLLWADTVIFQFPLWWFSMPAIMKGWVERVFSHGFGYGIGEHSDRRWGDRYGEGTLAGKRAMLLITAGGWEPHYSARGINGPIEQLMFPIQHGVLHYAGMQVLPPFLIYRTSRMDEARFAAARAELGQRLDTLHSTAPIPFRRQNHGDYDIPALTLKNKVAPDQFGLEIHVKTQE